jgi:hypothetical protein
VALIWVALAAAICVPLAAAAMSPLLEWRGPVYILAGFAGIVGLGFMLVQPLLIGGYLPGFSGRTGRGVHHWIGGALVVAVVIHVAGLWFTSPPDMIDALLFSSPTPFSPFGVIAMWAIFAVALLAAFRRRLRPRTWRIATRCWRSSSSPAVRSTPSSSRARWRWSRRLRFARWSSPRPSKS